MVPPSLVTIPDMTTGKLDAETIRELVQATADELTGDWLLLGGSLVALWLDGRRTTEDVDLVGMTDRGEQRFRLLEFFGQRGLPVETVNSAADYFVYRHSDWREQVELLLKGTASNIYRPSPTLFLLLKLGRLSEQDLEDCRILLHHCRREEITLDLDRLRQGLEVSPDENAPGQASRRATFLDLLQRFEQGEEIP